jgi:hypothetical protein
MFSTSRRWTGSSSAIKMLAAMAFPARYNYLSRIGALSPMPINVTLNLANRIHLATCDFAISRLNNRFPAR